MKNIKKFFFRNILPLLFRLFPIKSDTIVFSSFGGRNYSGNPKVICEKMIQQGIDLKYVWLIKPEVEVDLPKEIQRVAYDSWRAAYYLYTAKFWIDDSRKTIAIKKREPQIYFQTWHGTPLKLIEFDAKDKLSNHYLNYSARDSESITYLLSGNRYSSEIYPRAFKISKEKILNIGTPRNDQLAIYPKKDISFFEKKQLNILFAPTFRDNLSENGIPQLEKLNILEIKKYFATQNVDIIFMVKFHPNVNRNLSNDQTSLNYMKKNQFNLLPDGQSLEELFEEIDLLITDYSSIFFDYALLGKPLILFNYDEAEYKQERGFYLTLTDLPVPTAKNGLALIDVFKNQKDKLEYSSQRLLDFIGNFETGKSTDYIIELILKEV
ncbi:MULTISPECIES: CDP-glycerol glycerophosphotransferase family protein [Enterococcus]|uniref:CDP-glycerol glycerophosphotransferase family protein n=1 Tax=Enterococcus alishanensis TaxID=1303817 RepID=A0ABS6TAC8_9ENTE|nr:CDP-glycerol glycerophosphotransferase family protein [Enterococcus alishanensis]MBV7389862.1 CDP-glycerol glycerophosphotransferase family protein [Enterococcus alishanensis]